MSCLQKAGSYFISCDWGTSFFRLRLVAVSDVHVVAEVSSAEGIAPVYQQWQQKGGESRLVFYRAVLHRHIKQLQQKVPHSLHGLPVLVSGMASSSIGMKEVRYKELPFAITGSDLTVHAIQATTDFPNDIFLISGAKTDTDVLRGEETALVGCLIGRKEEEQFVILPGTHSKHIAIVNNKAVAFHTYMTGEIFELLTQKSILSNSVEKGAEVPEKNNRECFEKGVQDSLRTNLLQAAFRVRTNDLFGKMTKQENFYYLSGLLIGTEVKELAPKGHLPITLVSNDLLRTLYQAAMNVILPGKMIQAENMGDAIIRGQLQIVAQHKEWNFSGMKEKGE